MGRASHEVLVATPGTLCKKKFINWKGLRIKVLVLDEADELMQSSQLKKQAVTVKKECKPQRIFFFSATFAPSVSKFVREFMDGEPKWTINRRGDEYHIENLLQFYVVCKDDAFKQTVLQQIYENSNESQSLLFCTTKKECDTINSLLGKLDLTVGMIHGSLGRQDREHIMTAFRKGYLLHLVYTDVLAHIDIPEINLVINYSLPRQHGDRNKPVDSLSCIHSIRHCTRRENKRVVFNLISPKELSDLNHAEEIVGLKFTEVTLEEIPQLEARLREFRKVDAFVGEIDIN